MLVQKELRAFCKQHHIFFQAYSSLGCGQVKYIIFLCSPLRKILYQCCLHFRQLPVQLLHNDTVVSIATKYSGKTAAHILLRWAVQQGIGIHTTNDIIVHVYMYDNNHSNTVITGVIPKASSVNRVQENSEIFDFNISEDDMKLLSETLDTSHHFCWDPTDVA